MDDCLSCNSACQIPIYSMPLHSPQHPSAQCLVLPQSYELIYNFWHLYQGNLSFYVPTPLPPHTQTHPLHTRPAHKHIPHHTHCVHIMQALPPPPRYHIHTQASPTQTRMTFTHKPHIHIYIHRTTHTQYTHKHTTHAHTEVHTQEALLQASAHYLNWTPRLAWPSSSPTPQITLSRGRPVLMSAHCHSWAHRARLGWFGCCCSPRGCSVATAGLCAPRKKTVQRVWATCPLCGSGRAGGCVGEKLC